MAAIIDTTTPSEEATHAVTTAGEKHAVQQAIRKKNGGFLSESYALVEEMDSGSSFNEEETEESETVIQGVLRKLCAAISSHSMSRQMPEALAHVWISTDIEPAPELVEHLEGLHRQVYGELINSEDTQGAALPPAIHIEEQDILSDVVLHCTPKGQGTVRATLRCQGHAKPRIVAE